MQTMVPSHVWQRRTHRIIAMAVIVIGLTMMISTIPQCIYIGLVFIMMSLGWLAWMRMHDKKAEPPSPSIQSHAAVSPVLFLVASQNFTQRGGGPTPVDPNDKPPSYDQIIKLDGLPPDYFSILASKPPSYEDIAGMEKVWPVTIPIDDLPSVHNYCHSNIAVPHSSSISISNGIVCQTQFCSARLGTISESENCSEGQTSSLEEERKESESRLSESVTPKSSDDEIDDTYQ